MHWKLTLREMLPVYYVVDTKGDLGVEGLTQAQLAPDRIDLNGRVPAESKGFLKELRSQKLLRIAAVVVTFNRKRLLEMNIRSLLKQTYSLENIIVVDNASTDGTREHIGYIMEEIQKITYMALPDNTGGAGGFEYGMTYAQSLEYDYIWVMDDDVLPADNALEELVKAASSYAEAVAFSMQEHWSTQETIPSMLFSNSFGQSLKYFLHKPLARPSMGEIIEVDNAPFVSVLISRKVLAAIGHMDKEYFIYADDTDWFLRLKECGFKVLLSTTSIVKHGVGLKASDRRPDDWRVYYFLRNQIILLVKHRNHIAFGVFIGAVLNVLYSTAAIVKRGGLFSQWDLKRSAAHAWKDAISQRMGKIVDPAKGKTIY